MAAGHPHRRRRSRVSGRRFLLGFGITGAGLVAIAIAVAVGVGQVGAGPSCGATRTGTAALSLSALSLSALTVSSGPASGIATHYVLDGLPNCSYESPPPDQLFVALSPSEYAAAGGCGGYLEVTGPDGSVRVKVIDQCPECATGHIDLSEPAFARLAPLSAGLINVSYTSLADPALPGPVTLEVKTGSSPYWLALLADNTGNPLASVQVENASGGWISLARADYNYWITSSGAGSGPFTVRLTDTSGNQVTVSNIALSPGSIQSTGTYMYGAGSAPAPPAPAPSAVASTPAASTPAAPAPSPTGPAPSGAASSQAAASPAASSTASMTTRPSPSPSPKSSASRSAAAVARRAVSPGPRATDPQLAVAAPGAATAPSPSAAPTC